MKNAITGRTSRKLILTFSFLCLSVAYLFAFPARVSNISGREYFPAVKEAIDNAEESISAAIYIIRLREDQKGSMVYQLCKSLVDAKERGVEVRIILDQNVDFFQDEDDFSWEVEGKNETAFNFFRKHGVDVVYDDKFIYMHSKALVIDREIVIVGSANWSHSALTSNAETSVLIHSPELAESILESFSDIKLDVSGRYEPDRENSLALYKDFLTGKELGSRMLTAQDERAFDLYLLLLNEYEEGKTIDFDFDLYARGLSIDETMTPNAYRRQIIKSLRKLQDTYNLLNVRFQHGQNAEVELLDLKNKQEFYSHPEENYFLLPDNYFIYGWDRKLPLSAKFCYMINLYMAMYTGNLSWSLSRPRIGDKFGLHEYTVSKGMRKLNRLNLIDVEYSSIEEGYDKRLPSIYTVLDLYCSREQENEIEELVKKYGKESFEQARAYAEIVFDENNISIIEEIMILTEEYGKDLIKEAFDIVGKKAADNPKRTYKYAVGVIMGMRE